MDKKPDKEGKLLGKISGWGVSVKYSHTCLFQSNINLGIILQTTKYNLSQKIKVLNTLVKYKMF